MALNANLYTNVASNQPQTSIVSTTAIISGDGGGTNAFVVTEPTAIRRLDISLENKQGVFVAGLQNFQVFSTLVEGPGTILNGGTGYTAGTSTGVVLTNGGIATGRATVTVNASGVITSVIVTDGGTEYALDASGALTCTLSGGTPSIGAGSNGSVSVPLTTGNGTGTIPVVGWVVGTTSVRAARLAPTNLAGLGVNFPTNPAGFRVSLRYTAGNSCLATAFATGSPPGANMTCSRVSAGIYKFAFNSTRVSGGLPPVVNAITSLSTGQGPGVSAGSYSVYASIGLDGKVAGSATFGVEADPVYIDPSNGDIYVLCVDHNNVPRDPYPGSQISVTALMRNSSAAV